MAEVHLRRLKTFLASNGKHKKAQRVKNLITSFLLSQLLKKNKTVQRLPWYDPPGTYEEKKRYDANSQCFIIHPVKDELQVGGRQFSSRDQDPRTRTSSPGY